MAFSIDRWMEEYRRSAEERFGGRIWFMGLQGSYGRGEATEESDIDVVLILDRLDTSDLQEYSRMLDALPERNRICGFVSGREELLAWETSDLFQFCHDTVPVLGSLEPLLQGIGEEDIRRAVRIGACNIYHMCAHNLVHEKSMDILKGLYKSAAFTLQAVAFLQTGIYEKKKETLRLRLCAGDRQILETGLELKRKRTVLDAELMPLSSLLLEWSGGWIRRYGGSNRKKDVAIRK